MEINIYPDKHAAGDAAADFVANAVKRNPRIVLGLATGETPLGLYANLVKKYESGELSFSKAVSFNLDEYVGIGRDDKNSYA